MLYRNYIIKFSPDYSKIMAKFAIEEHDLRENYGFQIGESLFGVLNVYKSTVTVTIYDIETLLIKC